MVVETILVGTSGGRPIKVCVPEGWTGQCSVVLNVHKGRPSKHVQIVMGTTQELVGPEDKDIG